MSVDSHISNRMESVIKMVTPGYRVCDVGCDHAYVSIALVERGIAPTALAMDVNPGPLERADCHIQSAGYGTRIQTILSNGLENYTPGLADALIIAGMGGSLMQNILSAYPFKTNDFKELILSPQSEIADFRFFLYDNGYTIINEDMVFEDGKYYVVMKAVDRQEMIPYSEEELRFGRILLSEKNQVLKSYLEKEYKKIDNILCKLKKQEETEEIRKKAEELLGERSRLEWARSIF